jgi:hypothetical protein
MDSSMHRHFFTKKPRHRVPGPTREQIEEQVAQYLNRGGRIKYLQSLPEQRQLDSVGASVEVMTSGLDQEVLFHLQSADVAVDSSTQSASAD